MSGVGPLPGTGTLPPCDGVRSSEPGARQVFRSMPFSPVLSTGVRATLGTVQAVSNSGEQLAGVWGHRCYFRENCAHHSMSFRGTGIARSWRAMSEKHAVGSET